MLSPIERHFTLPFLASRPYPEPAPRAKAVRAVMAFVPRRPASRPVRPAPMASRHYLIVRAARERDRGSAAFSEPHGDNWAAAG
jgi:hypothetical protein